MRSRQCPFCGMGIAKASKQCPYCREAIPEVHLSRSRGRDGGKAVRRGLLSMLLGAVVYYFAGGYSSMQLPVSIQPMVSAYLAPLLFLGGLSLSLYGVYQRLKS